MKEGYPSEGQRNEQFLVYTIRLRFVDFLECGLSLISPEALPNESFNGLTLLTHPCQYKNNCDIVRLLPSYGAESKSARYYQYHSLNYKNYDYIDVIRSSN